MRPSNVAHTFRGGRRQRLGCQADSFEMSFALFPVIPAALFLAMLAAMELGIQLEKRRNVRASAPTAGMLGSALLGLLSLLLAFTLSSSAGRYMLRRPLILEEV